MFAWEEERGKISLIIRSLYPSVGIQVLVQLFPCQPRNFPIPSYATVLHCSEMRARDNTFEIVINQSSEMNSSLLCPGPTGTHNVCFFSFSDVIKSTIMTNPNVSS